MPTVDEVETALSTVMDPELDQSITSLDFVARIAVDDGVVRVALRLPTAFCSPNFAFLMAADALDAVRAVPGVREVMVELLDHHDSAQINAGLAAGSGFLGTYGDEAAAELDGLRRTFQAKAHLAAVERVCGLMLERGASMDDLPALVLGDLPDEAAVRSLLVRRSDLGLSTALLDPVLVDEFGVRWSTVSLAVQLRHARSTRISMEGNAHFCQGLLRTRYDLPLPRIREAVTP
jgi:metal-sulfur cluster biosynthetic enzyme